MIIKEYFVVEVCYVQSEVPLTIIEWFQVSWLYLTIIPRDRMGSESIAHEAEGRMGY